MTPSSNVIIITAVLALCGCECDALLWTRARPSSIMPIALPQPPTANDLQPSTALRASTLAEVKAQFLSRIESPIDDNAIYACPESLNPLVAVQRFYGPFTSSYFMEPGTTILAGPHSTAASIFDYSPLPPLLKSMVPHTGSCRTSTTTSRCHPNRRASGS